MGDRNDLHPPLDVVRDVGQVLLVLLRDQDPLETALQGRQQLCGAQAACNSSNVCACLPGYYGDPVAGCTLLSCAATTINGAAGTGFTGTRGAANASAEG